MNYQDYLRPRRTPQSRPIPGRVMVQNNAGGYTFEVSDWTALDRFLILGTEGGSHYVSEREMTQGAISMIQRCVVEDGPRVVRRLRDISTEGRAHKNDPALFVLALCSAADSMTTRKLALDTLPGVARTGSHLFTYMKYVSEVRGKGRGLRNALSAWYNGKDVNRLGYQIVKYRQRQGWTHADVLKIAHPKPPSVEHDALYRWATGGEVLRSALPRIVHKFIEMQSATNAGQVKRVLDYLPHMPWETIPTQLLREPSVWAELLPYMPVGALVRNMGRLTSNGTLAVAGATQIVCDRLRDAVAIHNSRIHPMSVLLAAATYQAGRGVRGRLTWRPIHDVTDALNDAFHLAFENQTPTGKRLLFGIDASGSMNAHAMGTFISCRNAAVAMALAVMNVETNAQSVWYTQNCGWADLNPAANLTDNVRAFGSHVRGVRTDCAAPILFALENNVEVDAFVNLTDNETWVGKIHPTQALQEYRRRINPNAKLIVVAMTATRFSICDPRDYGSLDVVGFDSGVPSLISSFIGGTDELDEG